MNKKNAFIVIVLAAILVCSGGYFYVQSENTKATASVQLQEQMAAEKAEADRLAIEKAAEEKAAAEKIAAEKAEADRLAAEKAAEEKATAEKIAVEKAEADRLATEKVAEEKAEADRLAAERTAAEQSNHAISNTPTTPNNQTSSGSDIFDQMFDLSNPDLKDPTGKAPGSFDKSLEDMKDDKKIGH